MKQNDPLRCYLNAEPNYSCTNESLPSIIAGMEPREGEKILAVCGSGDQAFALLESGARVTAVDKDVYQLEFAKARIEKLRTGDYQGFLHAPPASNPCDPIARDIYFRRGRRLENIRARLDNIEFKLQDVRKLGDMVDKAYLSNVLDWIPDDTERIFIQRLASHVRAGGFVYIADKEAIKEHKAEWQREFEMEAGLTQRATRLICHGETKWVPVVLRKRFSKN